MCWVSEAICDARRWERVTKTENYFAGWEKPPDTMDDVEFAEFAQELLGCRSIGCQTPKEWLSEEAPQEARASGAPVVPKRLAILGIGTNRPNPPAAPWIMIWHDLRPFVHADTTVVPRGVPR